VAAAAEVAAEAAEAAASAASAAEVARTEVEATSDAAVRTLDHRSKPAAPRPASPA